MKRAWVAALVLAGSLHAGAQDSIQSRILALENAWSHALQERDAKAVRELVGDELIYIEYDGTVMDKERYLASLKSSPQHADQIVNESIKVKVYGASAVAVGLYREKGTRHGKPYLFRERYVDTWLNRNGMWVCVASQSTLIKP